MAAKITTPKSIEAVLSYNEKKVHGKKLDKPNFRRKLIKMNLRISCNEKQIDVANRAASLYRFDKKAYDRLINKL